MSTFTSKQFNPAALPDSSFPLLTEVKDDHCPRHYLRPGTIFVSSQPYVITTILGSGIAVCLWDAETRIGGMNHYMHPEGGMPGNANFAGEANEGLLQQMLQRGANLSSMRASIFGGSLPSVDFGNKNKCLGSRNLEAAENFLSRHKIATYKRDTAGVRGRKLVFQTVDGKYWTQQL